MKRIILYFIFFYFVFNIEGNSSATEKFKPIEKINIYIDKDIASGYKSLKNHLTANCSVTFGYGQSLNNNGYINSSFSEYEIIDFLMRSNTSSLISCKNVIVDGLKISRFGFGTCNGKINDINISLFSTRKLDNNILERWLFYFKSFSAKEPNNNKETRTALIGDENVTFVSNSSTWSDSNNQQIFTVIYSSLEKAKKNNLVVGSKINFTQLKKCSKF